ncbi:hypothetical protein IAD21_00947 [Abditibacteriota bacterium]|nr:hypothetical protein IAD21_00947 [Abditibacteriota bacterium]
MLSPVPTQIEIDALKKRAQILQDAGEGIVAERCFATARAWQRDLDSGRLRGAVPLCSPVKVGAAT